MYVFKWNGLHNKSKQNVGHLKSLTRIYLLNTVTGTKAKVMLLWIGSIIETCVSYVTAIFRTTYIIGKILALILVKVSELGTHLSSLTYNVAVVFCECIQTFVDDIDYRYSHIIRMLNNGLQNGVNDITSALNRTSAGILWSIDRSKYETFQAIKRSRNLFTNSAFGARELLIQIGYAAWMLIILTVETIISIAAGIYNGFLSLGLSLIDGVVYATESLGYMVKSSIQFVISVPITSIVGCISISFVYYNRRSIINGLVHLLRLERRMLMYVTAKVINGLSTIVGPFGTLFHGISTFFSYLRGILFWMPSKLFRRSGDSIIAQGSGDSNLCITCVDRNRSVVLLPCRHFCLCRVCYSKLKEFGRQCPICRTNIRQNFTVYT